MSAPACRQCQSAALDDLGPLPEATLFAGQTLNPAWPGGRLFVCRRCHLGFRHPIRSEDAYRVLYAQAPSDVWVTQALRPDQLLVRKHIEAVAGATTVLDVGCYDGVLLGSLGAHYRKFGVEASAAAVREAERRGIAVVAAKIRDIATLPDHYDIICAVDVIEHVADPRAFVEMLVQRLAPGGTLILSTGSIDAPAWRFAGGGYWYCSYPEHISFISPAWCEALAGTLGLKVAHMQRFAYSEVGDPRLAKKRRSYYRKVFRARLRAAWHRWWPGAPGRTGVQPVHGQPGLFEDHIIVCLQRADAT